MSEKLALESVRHREENRTSLRGIAPTSAGERRNGANQVDDGNGSRHRQAQSLDGPAKKAVLSLTRCEMRVLSLVTQSKTNSEIARALGISPATVKRHLENILRKLELKNRVDAAIFAVRNGHALVKTSQRGEGCEWAL